MPLYARLSALLFLQYFTWGMWFVTLGTYLLQGMKLSGYEVGLAYGATAIASSLTPFLVGMAADRFFPSQRILGVLHLASGGLLLAASRMETFGGFYVLFLPYTLLYLPTFSLSSALCFRHIADPSSQYPAIRLWGSIGWILAGILVSLLGWEDSAMPMQISALVTLLHGLYSFTLPHTPPLGKEGSGQRWFSPEFFTLFRNRGFTVVVACLALSAIPASFYYSFVNPYLNDMGVGMAAAKMSLGQVSEMALMLSLPWLTLRAGLRGLLLTGYLAWGIRYLLLTTGIEWMMYGAILLHGVAFIFTALATQIYVDGATPPHLKSTVQGFTVFLTNGLGTLLGSWLAGGVVAWHTTADSVRNWPAIWWTPAVAGLAIALGFAIFFREKR